MALLGLSAGRILGWVWMDANGHYRCAGNRQLVMEPCTQNQRGLARYAAEKGLAHEIAERLEADSGDRIADLHIWRIRPGHNAAIVSLVSDRPETPADYKARLAGLASLSHVTVEVQCCPGTH